VLGSVSSRFGPRWGHTHSGIDIAAAYETTIHAAAAGKVIFVGWYGQYGRCVILDHGGGLTTLYGHASSILVHTGDHVQRGDAIAEVGSSGNSTGPHLHFEVRVAGEPRNPLNYLGG
jgi:murein DD-endopeptidase MepM/ murein hydrolase activator NlpD